MEYAIVIVAVLLLGAGSYKLLGGTLAKRSGVAGDTVTGESTGGGKGTGGGGGGGKLSGGSGDKASAASKVSVGGVGGGAGESNGSGRSRDTASDPNGPVASAGTNDKGGASVDEGFGFKRWFGIGLLAAGVIALGYVAMSIRRSKKTADAMGKDGPKGDARRAPPLT